VSVVCRHDGRVRNINQVFEYPANKQTNRRWKQNLEPPDGSPEEEDDKKKEEEEEEEEEEDEDEDEKEEKEK